jgi:hypothetical protein
LVLTAGDGPSGAPGPDRFYRGIPLGVGLGLFFVMVMLSGAGPPFEVMTGFMRHVNDILPLTYVTRVLQAPWLGTGLS